MFTSYLNAIALYEATAILSLAKTGHYQCIFDYCVDQPIDEKSGFNYYT